MPRDVCEIVRANAEPQVAEMMVLLDRSGSMAEEGRWAPSVAALKRVLQELQGRIRFGLAMFPHPSTDPNVLLDGIAMCLNAPDPQMCIDELEATGGACAPGKIISEPALDQATVIAQALDATTPVGGTPTGESLQALVDSYAVQTSDPDQLPVSKFVLLVTDGQPTCPAGSGMRTTQPDIDLGNQAIDALTTRGVRTYVIGYDTSGPGNEELAAVLDGFAQRGGTGDTQHRPVEDEQSLLSELQSITAGVVSCSFVLDQAPPRADFVLVRLDGRQLNLDEPDGWKLVGDRNVEITGAACELLRDGGSHGIEVEVRCEVVAPE